MEYFIIYLYLSLYDLLSNFATILGLALLPFSLALGFCTTEWLDNHHREENKAEKYKKTWMYSTGKTYIIACLIMFVVCSFVPSPKQLAIIVGLPAAYNVATSTEAQKLPDNILKAVNGFLEETAKEEDK